MPLLTTLYDAIGDHAVEVVRVTEILLAWVDEDGMRKRLEPNPPATRVAL